MLKSYPMNTDVPDVAKRVHELFKNRGLTLSTAESCTGGLVSHLVTGPAGASAFFVAGIVSYSAGSKERLLGVSGETVRERGVVSVETAREMAEKVRELTKTDCSVSTTGNLGPDVLEGKERGLVCIAACKEGKTVSRELRLHGDREKNKEDAAVGALRLLIELVESA